MTAQDYSPLARVGYPAALAALLALAVALTHGTGVVDATVVCTALIHVVYVVGLYCFVGNSGLISFGHVGFAAMGAYTVGLLTAPVEAKRFLLPDLPDLLRLHVLPDTWAFAVAAVGVAVIAGAFGAAIMKLRGIGASIVSLAFLVITNEFFNNWQALGNGGTVTRIPTRTTVGEVLAVAAVCILIAYLFQSSRTGLRLRAARDEENAARSLGISVTPQRTAAFVLGAVMMAIGGGLAARLNGTVSPNAFFFNLTFLTLAMLVVGGMRSLAGAVLGAVLVSALNEALRLVEATAGAAGSQVIGWRDVALSAVLILILLRRPEGLTGGREFTSWLFPRRRAADVPKAEMAPAVETK